MTNWGAQMKARQEAGLCRRCGLRPPKEGAKMCAECAKRASAERKACYRRKKKQGLCIENGCDKPVDRRVSRIMCTGCRTKWLVYYRGWYARNKDRVAREGSNSRPHGQKV